MYLSNPNMEAANNNTPMCLQCAYNSLYTMYWILCFSHQQLMHGINRVITVYTGAIIIIIRFPCKGYQVVLVWIFLGLMPHAYFRSHGIEFAEKIKLIKLISKCFKISCNPIMDKTASSCSAADPGSLTFILKSCQFCQTHWEKRESKNGSPRVVRNSALYGEQIFKITLSFFFSVQSWE